MQPWLLMKPFGDLGGHKHHCYWCHTKPTKFLHNVDDMPLAVDAKPRKAPPPAVTVSTRRNLSQPISRPSNRCAHISGQPFAMEFQVFFLFPFQFPNLFGLNSVSTYILSFNLFVKTCDWISVIFIHLRSGPGFFSGSPTNRVPAPPNRWRTRSWKKATKVISEAFKKQIKVCLARKVGPKKMQKKKQWLPWKSMKTRETTFSIILLFFSIWNMPFCHFSITFCPIRVFGEMSRMGHPPIPSSNISEWCAVDSWPTPVPELGIELLVGCVFSSTQRCGSFTDTIGIVFLTHSTWCTVMNWK